jgi:hypothetical protein
MGSRKLSYLFITQGVSGSGNPYASSPPRERHPDLEASTGLEHPEAVYMMIS